MRTIKLIYEFTPLHEIRIYTTNDGKDYERVINVIHKNPEKYKVIKIEHV